MMQERGVAEDPSTIMRWVHRYAPELEKRVRWYQSYRTRISGFGMSVFWFGEDRLRYYLSVTAEGLRVGDTIEGGRTSFRSCSCWKMASSRLASSVRPALR